jgi:hypothetical protein
MARLYSHSPRLDSENLDKSQKKFRNGPVLQFIFNPLKSSKAIAAVHDDLTAKFLGHGRMFWCIEAGLSSFMRRVAPIWNLQPDDRTRIDPKFFDCRAY